MRIERPSPPYRWCVAIKRASFYYEYPKKMDKFVWSIPCKYANLLDQEVSALCTCWIYDGSRQSVEAAREIDSWFNYEPFKFIAKKEYNTFILNNDQDRVVYGNITIKDCYNLFREIRNVLGSYKGMKHAFDIVKVGNHVDNLRYILKDIGRFSDKSIDSEGRLNLYFFMMVHCLEQYGIDQAELKAPLFEKSIIPICREMKIIEDSDMVESVTNHLKWFSEKHPMTYWVGIATIREYRKEEPRLAKKFAKMKIVKHRFRKR